MLLQPRWLLSWLFDLNKHRHGKRGERRRTQQVEVRKPGLPVAPSMHLDTPTPLASSVAHQRPHQGRLTHCGISSSSSAASGVVATDASVGNEIEARNAW